MSAACSTSYSSPRPHVVERRAQAQAGWSPCSTGKRAHGNNRTGTGEHHTPATSRRLSIRTRAASTAASAELATYQFAQRRAAGTTAEWFQLAVRDIVKKVDQSPFLQTVQLGVAGASPRFNTFGVHESVVSVPELWQGVAEHVSSHSPDVVILVQRVSPHAAAGSPQGAMDAAAAAQQPHWEAASGPSSSSSSTSPPSSPRSAASPPGSPRASHEMRVKAEEACRRLVSSGIADSILQGQVGDCCDGSGHGHASSHAHDSSAASSSSSNSTAADARQAGPRPLPLPAIVPFSPAPSPTRRAAVRTAALRTLGSPGAAGSDSCQQSACYWGVVVQSRRHTGAEGCYLLKTVKNVSSTGCSCTHFSLTRIAQGEHLEQQFVQSWLV